MRLPPSQPVHSCVEARAPTVCNYGERWVRIIMRAPSSLSLCMSRPPRSSGSAPRHPAQGGAGQVRIIGGRWRNTRLQVPQLDGLRPTSDRVRETLFNWLMPKLPGARVLDLFAGSGALGLEAVSRGAASAQLVERDPVLAAALRATVTRLDAAAQVSVDSGDALQWLEDSRDYFDFIVVDFPDPANFALGKLYTSAFYRLLEKRLSANGLIVIQSTSPLYARQSFWSVVTRCPTI